MKIAALQMVSTPRVADNVDTARRLMRQAASDGARLVVLPEYFCLMGHGDRDKLTIAEAAERWPDPARPRRCSARSRAVGGRRHAADPLRTAAGQ